jgi:hypothetical protein
MLAPHPHPTLSFFLHCRIDMDRHPIVWAQQRRGYEADSRTALFFRSQPLLGRS